MSWTQEAESPTTDRMVSCYCATYGRPSLLEEAIESFLRQDYSGPKELVVLNDYPLQRLYCSAPNVRIVNSEDRILPLGAKFNKLLELCVGDILCPWEDDDIYLPWRISYSVDHMQDGVFHSQYHWLLAQDGTLEYSRFFGHCNLAVKRSLVEEVAGYRNWDRAGIDADLLERLDVWSGRTQDLCRRDAFHIYRWSSTQSYHGSGYGADAPVSDEAERFVREQTARGENPVGKITLAPQWSRDWVKLARRAASREPAKQVL